MHRSLQLTGLMEPMASLRRIAATLTLLSFAAPTACSSSSSPGVPIVPPVDAGADAADAADAVGPSDADPPDGSPDAAPTCALGFLGDPTQPTILQLIVRDVSGVSVPLADGDTVPLVTPPQGGKVIFIGVRATNISPCSVELSGALRDPVSQQLRLDGRGMNLTPTGDGWGQSADTNLSTFANIPVCPNQWAMQDLYGQPFELTVKLSDPLGHAASSTLHVTPACTESGSLGKECTCTCKQGYVLGQVCN